MDKHTKTCRGFHKWNLEKRTPRSTTAHQQTHPAAVARAHAMAPCGVYIASPPVFTQHVAPHTRQSKPRIAGTPHARLQSTVHSNQN